MEVMFGATERRRAGGRSDRRRATGLWGARFARSSSQRSSRRLLRLESLETRCLLAADLVITEFQASNRNTLLDQDGDSSDWIEIHNPTNAPVELAGWSLTDDAKDLGKWSFPALRIDAGDYLIVFASGKDRADDSFRLTRDYNATADGTFLVDLADGVYDVRLTTGDADRVRDDVDVFLQGAWVDNVSTNAGRFLARTYAAEVSSSTGGRLALRLLDNGGATARGVINALSIISAAGQTVARFDFGSGDSPVEPGFTGVTAADIYQPESRYGWQLADAVFDRDRGLTEDRPHTNFKLSAGGEYLALVKPDGATVVSEYAPRFPPQGKNLSFGLEQAITRATPIAVGTAATVLIPTLANGGDRLGTSWTEPDFDDAGWLSGTTGIGYDDDEAFADLIGTDVGAVMRDAGAGAYLRVLFSMPRLTDVFSMSLRMKYNDGYVAYLNGVEVARRNAGTTVAWDSAARFSRSAAETLEFEDVDLSAFLGLLRPDRNVLAIHGMNMGVGTDADFLVAAELGVSRFEPIESTEGRFFTMPTPGGPNGDVSFVGLMAPAEVSVARGMFAEPFELQMSSSTPGATIVYTTDGTAPSRSHGVQLPAPDPLTPPVATIQIERTTVLQVAAFADDLALSTVGVHTYIFPADVASQDYQATLDAGFPELWGRTTPDYGVDPDVVGPDDLFGGQFATRMVDALRAVPTLSIVMDTDDLFGELGIYTQSLRKGFAWERPTSVELIYPDGADGFQVNAGIRIQGGFTRKHGVTKKKSLRLVFRREYGPAEIVFPLFGDDATDRFNTVILRTHGDDGWQWADAKSQPQYMRDEWMRATQLAMGQVGAHGNYMHVYINGIYWGLYNPTERPEASFSSTYFGGAKDEWDVLNAGFPVNGFRDAWLELRRLAADVDNPDPQASNAAYQRLLGNRPDGTDDAELETLLDVENYIDYMLLNFYGGNTDWPEHNWYVARRRGPDSTGFKFYSWDAEWTLNLRSKVTANQTTVSSDLASIYDRLRGNEEFRLLFADHVQQHFSPGGVFYVDPDQPQWDPEHPERNVPAARYSELADELELALIGESARWGDQHRELPYTLVEWRAERDTVLNDYFPQRSANVLKQLVRVGLYPDLAAPAFSQRGGEVPAGFELTISAPGDVYFTLDGSDPRRDSFAGGQAGIGATARKLSGPITLAEDTVVRARTYAAGQWSALATASFSTGAPALRITEIMYHPPDPAAGSSFADDDDFEFIELANVSESAAIDLTNMAFTRGIDFVFPSMSLSPGERVLVVRNEAAFVESYGDGIRVAGQYGDGTSSKLDNGGETIRLEDARGNVVQQFTYDDAWYGQTDGGGYSLEALQPERPALAGWSDPSHWTSSIVVGGSPGTDRAAAPVRPGDMNLDGRADVDDFEWFAAALRSAASYTERFGVPAALAGDTDGDGDLDFDDIRGLVALAASANRAALVRPGDPAAPAIAASPPTASAALAQPVPLATQPNAPQQAVPHARRPASLKTHSLAAAEARQAGRSPARRADRTAVRRSLHAGVDRLWDVLADRSLATETDWLS